MKGMILTLALLLCASPAGSAASDSYVSVRSENFELVGNADEKDIRRVALRLEQFRAALVRLIALERTASPIPIQVIVFRNKADYRPFMPVFNGRLTEVDGYYLSNREISYITLTADFNHGSPYATLLHEYVHSITHHNGANLPTWLDEGLAEFYSTMEISDGDQKARLGIPIASHLSLLRHQSPMPLARLFAIDHGSPEYSERDKRGLFYAQSWALVHYLMAGGDGARAAQIPQFLRLLRAGRPTEESFRLAFQTDYSTLEGELRDYIRSERFLTTTHTFAEKLDIDTDLQSAPLSEAEWNYYLGDLLRQAIRADCEIYLERALTLDPQLASAHASLGMWLMRQGSPDAAREHMRRAVAATSGRDHYLTHYYYAWLLIHEGGRNGVIGRIIPENIPRIRAALQKAIALRSDFAEPYFLLGFVSLMSGEQLEEAVSSLQRAISLSPARDDYRIQLANVYTRLSLYREARQTLEPVAARSTDPQAREEARAMIESVDRQMRFIAEHLTATAAQGADTAVTKAGAEPIADSRPPQMRRRTETETVQGRLVRINCSDEGVIFFIRIAGKLRQFRAQSIDGVQLRNFTETAGRDIACHELKNPLSVIASFRPSPRQQPNVEGELTALELSSRP